MKCGILPWPVAWVLGVAGTRLSKIIYVPRAQTPSASKSLTPAGFVLAFPSALACGLPLPA